MSAGTYNMSIDQGADFELLLTIKDSTDTLIDLTGHSFRGQIRKSISNATVVASFTFDIQDQITNTGEVKVSLSSAITSAILVPKQDSTSRKDVKYAYDIESEDGSGTVVRWLEGVVNLSPEVTR